MGPLSTGIVSRATRIEEDKQTLNSEWGKYKCSSFNPKFIHKNGVMTVGISRNKNVQCVVVLYTLCAIHSSVNLCSSCNMSLLSHSDSVKLIACDLIFYNSCVVVLRFVFHFSFMQCYPLGSNYLVGRVLCIYRFIEFFDLGSWFPSFGTFIVVLV